jgi:hypothetical protein
MKVAVNRSMTINTGNFTSIKPTIELSVDVAAADAQMAYVHLSKTADALMALEILSLSEEMGAINSVGWSRYSELLDSKTGQIIESLMDNTDKLVMMEM